MKKQEIINAITVASYLLKTTEDPLIEVWAKDDKNEEIIKRMVSLYESVEKLKLFVKNMVEV